MNDPARMQTFAGGGLPDCRGVKALGAGEVDRAWASEHIVCVGMYNGGCWNGCEGGQSIISTTLVEAVYERGLFRPTEPVSLREGQRVWVHMPPPPSDSGELLDALRAMADDPAIQTECRAIAATLHYGLP